MLTEDKKAKRCKVCGRMLRHYNMSELCHYHFERKWQRERYAKQRDKRNKEDMLIIK